MATGPFKAIPPWTKQDSTVARTEGWDLFHVYDQDKARWLQLVQRVDDRYLHDAHAQQIVSAGGTELRRRAHALAFRSCVGV